MRVMTLGGLGGRHILPRSFAPDHFVTETGLAIPGSIGVVPQYRGVAGLGTLGLTDTIGTFTLGAVVGGALGFALGAAVTAFIVNR